MNIGITTLVTPAKKSGVGNYIINLLNALQKIDEKNEYYVFIGQDTKHLFSLTAPNFHSVYLPLGHDPRWLMRPLYFLWQNSLIYFTLKRYQIDVLHLPNSLPLVRCFVPTVVTIHDLAEFVVPRYSKARQSYRKLLPHLIARKAERIIAVSNSARSDIVEITGCDPNKIDVIYEAAGIGNSEYEEQSLGLSDGYNIERPYLLHVGGTLPHKNLLRLVDAFTLLKRQDQIPHILVLVGYNGNKGDDLFIQINELIERHEVISTGYISDKELSDLYRNASVFVFPSLYEGFGLPVLEAMIREIPVITSNVSSLPEVAGNAALLVDPTDTIMIAEAILSVLTNEDLRGALIRNGNIQAAKFSWDECARQTLAVYSKACGG